MGRDRPSNEDAPRVPGEEGGRPWGRIVLGLLLLLALALLIPFACQALQGSGERGSGDSGSSGAEKTTTGGSGTEKTTTGGSGNEGRGAGGGNGENESTSDGQGASGGETTARDTAGDGGERAGDKEAGGTEARIADIAGSQDGRVVEIPRAEIPDTEGWIAVHADDGGQPGEVLGVAPLSAGRNTNVEVELDRPLDSPQRLYAMLHKEDPANGEYTFPDGDPPVREGGEAVVEPFDYALANTSANSANAGTASADTASGDETSANEASMSGDGVEDEPLPDSGGGELPIFAGGLALLAAGGLLRLHVRRTQP